MTPSESNSLKSRYDILAEQVLDRLNEISPPPTNHHIPRNEQLKDTSPDKPPKRDLYAILQSNYSSDETLQQFWNEVNTVPDWVDWDQIARGQDVFYRYGGPVLTGLAYQSLLGGMGAARVVEVLSRTGGFAASTARHRLFETTQHLLQCTKSLQSIQPGGEGWIATIRVRLLHVAVRNRILKLAETRPEYYDKEEFGIPINDHDCVGTIISFSASLIWLSLPRQGIFLRQQEIKDYIALWRYIAYLIGTPTTGYLETPEQSKRMLESIMLHEIKPSRTSQILANNVIKSLQDRAPGYASASFLVAGARWLNGNDLCDALALPRPGVYYTALTAGQCIFFGFWCYFHRMRESWDKKHVAALRRIFWKIVVKDGLEGEETGFELKYMPEYSIMTEMGKEDQGQEVLRSEVERASLKWLVMAVAAVAAVGFVWVKVSLLVVGLAVKGARSAWILF